MKTSYLHVYLVPTRLLIFRKNSHLHVYLVYTFIQYHGVLCKKHIESVHGNKNANEFSTCGYNYFLKCTLGKHIESVHDDMTSCNCSICGHNFILKSNHNNSLK